MKIQPEKPIDEKHLPDEYRRLLQELDRLKEENRQLKARLQLLDTKDSNYFNPESNTEKIGLGAEATDGFCDSIITNKSDSTDKIRLFKALFKGREDVYAKRWENKKKNTSGYSPVCLNEWSAGICSKPKIACSKCAHKSYAVLDKDVIENHLRGNIVAGIYPMFPDETCCFLAIDFDEDDWQKDITALRRVCAEFAIPFAVERSRSGNGGHVWFFFENQISVSLARKLGIAEESVMRIDSAHIASALQDSI
jgi:hypothetical protein